MLFACRIASAISFSLSTVAVFVFKGFLFLIFFAAELEELAFLLRVSLEESNSSIQVYPYNESNPCGPDRLHEKTVKAAIEPFDSDVSVNLLSIKVYSVYFVGITDGCQRTIMASYRSTFQYH